KARDLGSGSANGGRPACLAAVGLGLVKADATARRTGLSKTPGGKTRSTSSSRAGSRSDPVVRHGALRRRQGEWGRPYYVLWRSALADDAEWMHGKSRYRLAFDLDGGFLMDA